MPPLTSCSPSSGGGIGQAGLLGQYNVPALPLISCVTLDKSLSLSAPLFLSLLNSSGNCPCPVGLEVGTGKGMNTRNILKTVAHVRSLLQDSQDVSHRRRASHRQQTWKQGSHPLLPRQPSFLTRLPICSRLPSFVEPQVHRSNVDRFPFVLSLPAK